MRKFCIIATPKSEIALSESKVFVFSSEMLEHAAKHGNLIMFDCSKFSVDEEASSANWREVFNFNEEPPRGVIVTVNNDYKSGIVMPYADWRVSP